MQTQIIHDAQVNERTVPNPLHSGFDVELYDIEQEAVYANSYVDMGAVDTVGFDYDYTLVTYTETLLELIYDMALRRLVEEKEYPREMLEVGLKFDPSFSIRGKLVVCLCKVCCVNTPFYTIFSFFLYSPTNRTCR